MKKPDDAEYEDAYMKDSINDIGVFHSMYIVNKGVGTIFKQIRIDFISIDFSENSFSGNIPESSIGLLKGLRLLLSMMKWFTQLDSGLVRTGLYRIVYGLYINTCISILYN